MAAEEATDYMVRVRAVVMTRDDSSGGWVPMGGGGLSHVTICKVRHPDEGQRRQYLINGERLRDQTTILECTLKRDLVYNKVNPIFHHWKVGDNKFGLTFQSPADAVTFEKGVQAALKEITEGEGTIRGNWDEVRTDSESSSNSQKEMLPKPITIVTSESSSTCFIRTPISEEFPFSSTQGASSAGPVCSQNNLPSRLLSFLSLSPSSPLSSPLFSSSSFLSSLFFFEELESITPCPWVTKGYEDYRRAVVQKHQPDPEKIDLCVHFEKGGRGSRSPREKEYSFPPGAEGRLKDPKASPSSIMGVEEDTVPSRCVYCRDVFNNEENGRGQCQDAPDPIGHCVYQFTCMWCAESMLYHCMSDSEGEYSDPCSCDTGHPHFCIRWLALATLSLVVPCMCCYLPLHACYSCGERCGCCGGKHKAVR
uniref:Sprouty related EVH1 domain containing 3 n=1 Tax=Laticauda laticaudata TaxID=8630 RepID=A0A8C5WYW3_LATLA